MRTVSTSPTHEHILWASGGEHHSRRDVVRSVPGSLTLRRWTPSPVRFNTAALKDVNTSPLLRRPSPARFKETTTTTKAVPSSPTLRRRSASPVPDTSLRVAPSSPRLRRSNHQSPPSPAGTVNRRSDTCEKVFTAFRHSLGSTPKELSLRNRAASPSAQRVAAIYSPDESTILRPVPQSPLVVRYKADSTAEIVQQQRRGSLGSSSKSSREIYKSPTNSLVRPLGSVNKAQSKSDTILGKSYAHLSLSPTSPVDIQTSLKSPRNSASFHSFAYSPPPASSPPETESPWQPRTPSNSFSKSKRLSSTLVSRKLVPFPSQPPSIKPTKSDPERSVSRKTPSRPSKPDKVTSPVRVKPSDLYLSSHVGEKVFSKDTPVTRVALPGFTKLEGNQGPGWKIWYIYGDMILFSLTNLINALPVGWWKINLNYNCSDENTVSLGWQDVSYFLVSKIWKSQNTRLSIHFSVLVRARHSSTIHASNITQIQAHMHSYHTNIRPTHK